MAARVLLIILNVICNSKIMYFFLRKRNVFCHHGDVIYYHRHLLIDLLFYSTLEFEKKERQRCSIWEDYKVFYWNISNSFKIRPQIVLQGLLKEDLKFVYKKAPWFTMRKPFFLQWEDFRVFKGNIDETFWSSIRTASGV